MNVLASPGALLFVNLFRFLLWYGRVGVNGSVAPEFRRCLVVSFFFTFLGLTRFWLYLSWFHYGLVCVVSSCDVVG